MDQFSPLLLEAFGPSWFETGSLSLYFRQATTDDEPVQAYLDRPATPGPDSQVKAWMTEPSGVLVAEGTASVGNPSEPSAIFSRDLRPVVSEQLRILHDVHAGDSLGEITVLLNGDEQRRLVAEQLITEPLDWYTESSPWGGPIASPSATVRLLYDELLAPFRTSLGTRVGLFGAIEIRYFGGPIYLDREYHVSGKIVAVSETPKTEVLWFDSWASEPDGRQLVRMRMMLRQMKASSPLYPEMAEGSEDGSSSRAPSAGPEKLGARRAMELDLGPEVREFRLEIREWIERNTPDGLADLAPWSLPSTGSTNLADERERATSDPAYRQWEQNLIAAGLICPNWPKEYGGRGLSPIEMVVFEEECQRAGVPRIERGLAERIAGPAILIHGTPEQKAYFLPRIVTATDVYCQGYSEPDHGSDLAAIETKGVVDGDEVVISGHKIWTSGAKRANMIFILCRTDPSAPRHRGISYVLAPFSPDNGIELSPVMQLNGSSQFCEEFFEGTRAPLFNVIGGLNNGWRPAMSTLAFERGGKATILHLGFEIQFWDLVRDVQARGLNADPLVRQQLAWAYTRISVMRYAGLRLTAQIAAGKEPGPEASIAKVFRSEYHRRFGEIALDLMGANGLIRPEGEGYSLSYWQDVFLSSRAATLMSGTSEIQRNIIGERALGLPKEPSIVG